MKASAIPLRKAIALSIGLLLILAAATQTVLQHQSTQQRIATHERQQLKQLTDLASARIDSLLGAPMVMQRELAAEIANRSSDNAFNPQGVRPLTRGMTNDMGSSTSAKPGLVYVPLAEPEQLSADTERTLEDLSRSPLADPRDLTHAGKWTAFAQDRSPPHGLASSLGCVQGSGQCLMYASIVRQKARMLGVAAATLPMQLVSKELARISATEKVALIILNAGGDLVMFTNGARGEAHPSSQPKVIRASLVNHQSSLINSLCRALCGSVHSLDHGIDVQHEGQTLRGYVASYSSHPELQWRLVALQTEQPHAEETAPTQIAAPLMVISLGCLGIFGVCWLMGDAANAIRHTTEAASTLTLNKPYLPMKRNWALKESRQLAEAFDLMATRLQQEHAQFLHSALTDPVTQLASKLGLMDQVKKLEPCKCAWFYVSLPRFHSLKSVLGTDASNQILYALAERMRDFLPAPVILARIGEADFALLFEDHPNSPHISTVGSSLQKLFDKPVEINREAIHVPAAIGYVGSMLNPEEISELLNAAEMASTEARQRHLNEPKSFSIEMKDAVSQRQKSTHDIQRALSNAEFLPHYQPIIDLVDGHVVGLEALIRWRHPTLGLVLPRLFLPAASESDLIVCLDRLMLQTAIRDARTLYEQTGIWHVMHVNISARCLLQSDFLEEVHALIEASRIPRDHLTVEIDGVAFMLTEDKLARFTLHGLNTMGIRVAVDDFGPGQSNLSCLGHQAISAVKIDRSFVVGVTETGSRESLLTMSLIEAANNLNVKAVAEGIETQAQLNVLRAMGCRHGQGYLLAPPTHLSAIDFSQRTVASLKTRRSCAS